jgi:hypothetical protein
MADSLSLPTLVLLESLSPEQRAVLLMHDVFDYDYPQVAEIIGKSQDNVRQLATRARRHVAQRRPRFQTTREQREELTARFLQAVEQSAYPGSRHCSLTMWSSRVTAAARRSTSRAHCAAATASRAPSSTTRSAKPHFSREWRWLLA